MNDLLPDRCRTICGEYPTVCFIGNIRHVECISDLVINRAWSAREIIELGSARNRDGELAELLDMAIAEMDTLIVWAQRIRAMRAKSGVNGEVACSQ